MAIDLEYKEDEKEEKKNQGEPKFLVGYLVVFS